MFNLMLVLQVVLVILKLQELITISWGFVFIPVYIIIAFLIINVVLLSVFYKDS